MFSVEQASFLHGLSCTYVPEVGEKEERGGPLLPEIMPVCTIIMLVKEKLYLYT